MCYSYRDHEAREEARKMMREREDRRRHEERAKDKDKESAPKKERELVRA